MIMCEGKTEKNYFQAIKEDVEYQQSLSALNPQVIAAKNPTPEQVVLEALKRRKKEASEGNPYDEVWVVFDHDSHENRKNAYDEALENGIDVIFSAICFEIWFLLHFKYTTRSFPKASNLIQELKRHYPDYEKAKRNDFENLKDDLKTAISNAEKMRNNNPSALMHTTDRNPWVNVDLLVKRLTNL